MFGSRALLNMGIFSDSRRKIFTVSHVRALRGTAVRKYPVFSDIKIMI